ncbi:MAG: hypothetical protein WD824_14450 [Cyclobacteriaceae bacterium]
MFYPSDWDLRSAKRKKLILFLEYIKIEFQHFAFTASEFESVIRRIDNDNPQTIGEARIALRNCRLHYKKIAFFLEYFFPYAAITYNSPAKVEVEETYMEFNETAGGHRHLLFADLR